MDEKPLPDSFIVLKNILREMGVDEYEPRVLYAIHTFMQGHAIKLIKDAQRFSISAGKSIIDTDDMHLTLKCSDEEMHTLPKRETMHTMAAKLNCVPLSSNKNMNGIRLPQPKKIKLNWSVSSKFK